MCLAAQNDPDLRQIMENAALVVPESWGIQWASRRLGEPLKEFTPGIDLMQALCAIAEQDARPVYLLGSAPGAATAAAAKLHERFPNLVVVGTDHGYFGPAEEAQVIRRILDVKPTLLFVGMGMPAQEKWIARNLAALKVPVVMGVGGSFDVLSGELKRAPAWMRRSGVEWLYRLAQEPWRWRRIAMLPIFAGKVLRQKWRGTSDV